MGGAEIVFSLSLSPLEAGHKKAGRSDLGNQRFEPDAGKMRKIMKVTLTQDSKKKQRSEESPWSESAENAENADSYHPNRNDGRRVQFLEARK